LLAPSGLPWTNYHRFVFGSFPLGGLFRSAVFREMCRHALTRPAAGRHLALVSDARPGDPLHGGDIGMGAEAAAAVFMVVWTA
jgi:hypothetical protein